MPYKTFFGRFGTQAEQIEFLQTIVDSLPVAVFCKDAEDSMRILIWNKDAERLFGLPAKDVVGKTTADLLPSEVSQKFVDDDFETVKGGKTVFIPERVQINLATKKEVCFRLWKVPLQTPTGAIVLCIAQDITEIKKAEIESREQERRLKSISSNVPGLLYQFKMDPHGTFSFPFFSRKSSDILGVDADSIYADAQAVISLVHKDDLASFEQSLLVTIQNLTPWRWEGRFWSREKGLRWFQGASTPVRQADGSIIWDGILFDVTAQKEAEEKLRLQEAQLAGSSKLIALGEMAGGVAHEINTPLNAILFCAEQIQCSLKENSFDKRELSEMSELISETAQRIAKIVTGLKTFARDGSSEAFEVTSLETIVDQTLILCSQRMQQNGVRLEFIKPTDPIIVSCRTVQLGQVVLNLLNNAFDSVVDSKWPWIKIAIRADQYSAYIEVTDSGGGLTPEVRAKLFQPFFTTKGPGKGTGLGLSISKGIVEAHEGRLYVDESAPNTRFVVELPTHTKRRGVA